MDFAILVALTLCQAVTGFMGFHVSITALTPQQRTRWRFYFLAITLFGVGLVVWSGVRSADVQGQILALLSPPPRLAVDQIVPFKMANESDLRFNVYFMNNGQHEIKGLLPHYGVAMATGLLPKSAEDKIFWRIEKLPTPSPDSTDMMEPGESRNTTIPSLLTDHTGLTEASIKGHVVYVAVVFDYFDGHTKDLWRTEACDFWDFRVPQELWGHMNSHKCIGHNEIIGPKAK